MDIELKEPERVVSALTNRLIARVTNYFDTSIRVPVLNDPLNNTLSERDHFAIRSNGLNGVQMLSSAGTASSVNVPKEHLVAWYSKLLDGVKQRYRKLQRLARSVGVMFQAQCSSSPRFESSAYFPRGSVTLRSTTSKTSHLISSL